MKYMVMVNGKYMTQVETDKSACGAEHIILDDICYGMVSAQAFDAKAMKTSYFNECFQSCELVSLTELKTMSEKVRSKVENEIAVARIKYEELTAKIEKLQEEQKEAYYEINRLKSQRGEAV